MAYHIHRGHVWHGDAAVRVRDDKVDDLFPAHST